ncbi:MAG: response regulator [Desulfobacterota bacterium]|nr:response regulator [Thermodesulfobacteriota bacterium]
MKALIVDDNECIRHLYKLYLHDMNFDTDEAQNGNEAFGLLSNCDYDLIISDVEMPDLNGIELYKLVNIHKPYLLAKFIFATGDCLGGSYRNFFSTITCPVLTKPFSFNELQHTITEIIKW